MKHFILILFLSSQIVYGQTYYVANNGNDNASGTSVNEAWMSIGKVNSALSSGTIKSGNTILFRKGDVFRGQLNIRNFTNVTISAFGDGEKPVISGNIATSNSWQAYNGNIWSYQNNSLKPDVRKLAINGTYKAFGRWPDIVGNTDGADSWREYKNAINDTQFDDKLGLSVGNNYWDGAEVVAGLVETGWLIHTYKIISQVGNTFYYDNGDGLGDGAGYYYYLQNHVNALNKEGEWAYKNKTVYLYSATSPNNSVVEVSNQDTTLKIINSNDIVIEGLNITGSNQLNIWINNAKRIRFSECDINGGAYDGISMYKVDSVIVQKSVIRDIGNNGIYLDASNKIHILDNNFHHIGIDRGAGGLGGTQSVGIKVAEGRDISIKYNELSNIGYCGIVLINYTTFNCTIANNYIHDYCLTKGDGGGIYTWQLNPNHNNGNVLDHNIIRLGDEGENLGMVMDLERNTYPIYCDDRTDYIKVTNNTCVGGWFSIYLHSAGNMTVNNNTFYGGYYCLAGLVSANATIQMVNNVFNNNNLIFNNSTLRAYFFNNMSSALGTNTVKFNNNNMVNLYENVSDIYAAYGYISGPSVPGDMGFPAWQALSFTTNESALSKEIFNGERVTVEDHILFAFNPTKNDSTIDLGNNICVNTKGEPVGNSVTVAPYESVFLVKVKLDSCFMSVNATIVNDTNNAGVGSITLDVKGAVPPYSYVWKNSNVTENVINNLLAGTYTCTITSSNKCVTSRSYVISTTTNGGGNDDGDDGGDDGDDDDDDGNNNVPDKGDLMILSGCYPNPTPGDLTISCYCPEDTKIKIITRNTLGRSLLEQDYHAQKGDNQVPVDLSAFASGTYTVTIKNGTYLGTYKVVKQ